MTARKTFTLKSVLTLVASAWLLLATYAHASEWRTLTRATELRADSYSDAAVVSNLAAGARAELLRTQGVWALVKAAGDTGWVRFSALSSAGASPTGISLTDTGRMAGNNVLATTGIRSMRVNRHALIVGVGEYSVPSITPLTGVTHDIESAKRMAFEMGIPDSNITVLRDKNATLAAMKQALADLNSRVNEGDRVFFYFSGHGTRWFNASVNDQSCTEALMPADGQPLTNQAIAALLKPISDKTDKLMVLYDACHSGGIPNAPLSTRSLVHDGELFVPKMTAAFAPAQCSVPSNMRTRSLTGESLRLGALNENIVHISSSRPDEVSFDIPGRGGVATMAFRDCMLGEARDSDGSGSLNISEILNCAQTKVNKALANARNISAPTMEVTGNKGFVPALFKQDRPAIAALANTVLNAPAPVLASLNAPNRVQTAAPVIPVISAALPTAPAPSATTSPPTPAPAPTPPPPAPPPTVEPPPMFVPPVALSPVAPPPVTIPPTAPPAAPPQMPLAPPVAPVMVAAAPVVPSPPSISPTPPTLPAPAVQLIAPTVSDPASAFDDALALANGKIKVGVKTNQAVFKIGKDELLLDITSNAAGFVNIVMLGSDRKSFVMLFPNALDANNAIKPGETLRLPRKHWGIVPQGPAGIDDILVIVTESPRDLSAIGGEKAGPFLANLTHADGRANLQWLLGTSVSFDTFDCSQGGKTRSLAVVKKCSDSFGAARVSVREVP